MFHLGQNVRLFGLESGGWKRNGVEGKSSGKWWKRVNDLVKDFAHPCTSMGQILIGKLNQSCSQVDDMSHISTVQQYMHAFTQPLTFFKSSSCTKWLGRWAGGA